MRDIRRYCEKTALEPLEIRDSLLGDCSSFIEEMNASASKPRPIILVDCYTREHFDQNLLEYPLPRRVVGNAYDLQQYESGITMLRPTANNPAPSPVTNLGGVIEWMLHYPLRTLETILNLIDYGTNTRWQFWKEDEYDKDGFVCPFTLKKLEAGIWNRDLAVFIVPPWMMRLDDFRTFTRLDLVGDLRSSVTLKEKLGSTCELTKWELLWCYMYDYCAGKSIDHFALTTYDNWVFGNFNLDFGVCHASVTCVKSSDCISPSILQAFLFVARRAEHRDIGLNSDTASTASWESNGTARPVKRKAPPEANSRNSRFKSFHSSSTSSSPPYFSRGSGSHRRIRRSKAASLRRSRSRSVASYASRSESPTSSNESRRQLHHNGLPVLEYIMREDSPEVDLASADGTESRVSLGERHEDIGSMDEGIPQTINDPVYHLIVPAISHWQQGVAQFTGHSTPSPRSNASLPRMHSLEASSDFPELHLNNDPAAAEPTGFSWDDLGAVGSPPGTPFPPTLDSLHDHSSFQNPTSRVFENVIPNTESYNGSTDGGDPEVVLDTEMSAGFEIAQTASPSPQLPTVSVSYAFPRNSENNRHVPDTSLESSPEGDEASWCPPTVMSRESQYDLNTPHEASGNADIVEERVLFPGTLQSLNFAPATRQNAGALDSSEYTNYDGPSRPISAVGSRGGSPDLGSPNEDNDIDWHHSEYSVGEASDTFSFRSDFSTETAARVAAADFECAGGQLTGGRHALRRMREALQAVAEDEDEENPRGRAGSRSLAPSSPSPAIPPPPSPPLYDVGMAPDDRPWPHVSLPPTVEEIISDNISDCSSAASMSTETRRETRRIIKDAMDYTSPPPE